MSDSRSLKKDGALIRPATGRSQSDDLPAFFTEEAMLRLEGGLRAQREQQVGRRFCEPDARSQGADKPVMASIEPFLAKRVKLSVDKSGSGATKPSDRKGFSFTGAKGPRWRTAPQPAVRFQAKTRELTWRTRGRRLEQLRAIAWKRWTRGPTSSRAKIRTEDPISSPFGRRQKLGLLLCALLLIVAVSALGVSLKTRIGGSTDAASVNTLTRGRTASMPPDRVEPRQPNTKAVKSTAATLPLALPQLFVIAREAIDFPPTSPRRPRP